MEEKEDLLSKISALAKRRGFIFPSSEIYGGMANTYDFGPLGTELKENIRKLWWRKFVQRREDIFGIDASIIINPKVWEASGHTAAFGDVMVEDVVTKKRYRADHLIEEYFLREKGEEVKVDGKSASELQEIIEKEGIKSSDGNDLSKARKFNLLFETEIGIIEEGKNKAYLRGEIAQGLFINFKNILDSMIPKPKLPFGIAQAGKAFRNEITKGQFTFRTLEFDLMEFEYFFDPEDSDWNELFEYWKSEIYDFAMLVGLDPGKLRWRQHESFELSHYSKRTEDLEYNFPWGFKEMFACAYRTDFDLRNHMEKSGIDLRYQDPVSGRKFIPHVVEPTFGLSRLVTIILMDSYREEIVDGKERVYLKLDKKIAPVKVAVFPLQKDEKLESLAKEIYKNLKEKIDGIVIYDNTGNIGKNYRRQDEIGTPFCITVDFDSLSDNSVTVRERDSMKQERIEIDEVFRFLKF